MISEQPCRFARKYNTQYHVSENLRNIETVYPFFIPSSISGFNHTMGFPIWDGHEI